MEGTTKEFAVIALRELANEIAEGRVVVRSITVDSTRNGGAYLHDPLGRFLEVEVASPPAERIEPIAQ